METYDWLFDDSSTEVHQTEESSDEPVWTTAEGKHIPLSKMSSSHIHNCINMLKGKRSVQAEKWIANFTKEINRRSSIPFEGEFTL